MADLSHSALLNVLTFVYFWWSLWPCNYFLPIHFSYQKSCSTVWSQTSATFLPVTRVSEQGSRSSEKILVFTICFSFPKSLSQGVKGHLHHFLAALEKKGKRNHIPVHEVVGSPTGCPYTPVQSPSQLVCEDDLGGVACVWLGQPWRARKQPCCWRGPSVALGEKKIISKATHSTSTARKTSQWTGYFEYFLVFLRGPVLNKTVCKQAGLLFQ